MFNFNSVHHLVAELIQKKSKLKQNIGAGKVLMSN